MSHQLQKRYVPLMQRFGYVRRYRGVLPEGFDLICPFCELGTISLTVVLQRRTCSCDFCKIEISDQDLEELRAPLYYCEASRWCL